MVAEDYVGGFGVGLDVVGAGFEVEFSVADGGLLGEIREEKTYRFSYYATKTLLLYRLEGSYPKSSVNTHVLLHYSCFSFPIMSLSENNLNFVLIVTFLFFPKLGS